MATCGGSTEDGTPCQRRTDGGRCFLHDGTGLPPGHGAPRGNDHAKGNPGGGAPPRNSNAAVHGVFSSEEKMDERLRAGEGDMDVIHYMALLEYDIWKRSRRNAPGLNEDRRRELAHEYVLLSQKETRADIDFFERGVAWPETETVETEGGPVTIKRHRVNPTFEASSRLTRRVSEIGHELKVWPKYDE